MFKEYTTADAVGGKYDPMATHFFNGEVAMFPNGPWMIPDFREPEKAPEGFYDKVGIMLMPGNGMETVSYTHLWDSQLSRSCFDSDLIG